MGSPLKPKNLSRLAREAKALVAMAFRNGPIEDIHAGKSCTVCDGKSEYSHISQSGMREIMKAAVDRMYTFLIMKDTNPKAYEALLKIGGMYSSAWDEPELTKDV